MQISSLSDPAHPQALPTPDRSSAALMDQARALEAVFLAEMLTHAGLGRSLDGGFGGGIGEDQFASFLRHEQATQMAQRGGIGLAEHLFRAMTRGDGQ